MIRPAAWLVIAAMVALSAPRSGAQPARPDQPDPGLAAQRIRLGDAATAGGAGRMEALERQRAATEQRLAARAAELRPLLPLIARLAQYPAATLLSVPTTPEQAVRGALLLRSLSAQIVQDAEAARAEGEELAATRRAIAAQAADLDQQVSPARRDPPADPGAEAARRTTDQATHALSLGGAIEPVAQHRDRPPGDAGEKLTAPVAGTVTRAFGDATDSGPANGISYRPAPAARVVSPCGGKVVFGGPFRSFGLLLIVDCGGGTHFVLAGFDRLDVTVGRHVQAGEPVGVMPAWDSRSSGERPTLYVELRRNGIPINPAPWLRSGG